MNKKMLLEAFGWYGVVALVGSYALVSFGIFGASDFWFQVLNVTGALGIVFDALAQKNWQPATLNIIWAVIGLFALVRIIF